MSESNSDDEKTHDPTPRKLAQLREDGDVPVSREGSVFGGNLAALLGVLLAGQLGAQKIGDLLYPMIDQPEAFIDLNGYGLQQAGIAVAQAVALALGPFFGLLIAGAVLPHVLQNSVVVTAKRMAPNLSKLSPMGAMSRIFGGRALFEFGKNLAKLVVISIACYTTARPLYQDSMGMINMDIRALLPMIYKAIVALLGIVTLVSVVVAGIDVPYQHWSYLRRHRMSLQDIKDEHKMSDGNPEIKAKIRRMRMNRSRGRMMQDVKKASVVITNPTHYAVALRYERGKDAAPVVVAKGMDLVAQNIKAAAREAGVAITEDKPLARALHASVEIGQTIPREHFEAVAKIIGLIWAQKNKKPSYLR